MKNKISEIFQIHNSDSLRIFTEDAKEIFDDDLFFIKNGEKLFIEFKGKNYFPILKAEILTMGIF